MREAGYRPVGRGLGMPSGGPAGCRDPGSGLGPSARGPRWLHRRQRRSPPNTVNATAFDVPPTGSTTVTGGVPAAATRLAGTVAVSGVAETKVVASAVPANFTVQPLWKFAPVTVRVNCGAARRHERRRERS